MADELDRDFFEHMQWEVEQQVVQKNRRLLDILELVIQRACVQVEAGEPAVQLLSTLLQTHDRDARLEYYKQILAQAPVTMRSRFAETVQETRMHVEKASMRSEPINQSLLRQLRLISIEMVPYLAPSDLTERCDHEMDDMGI
uniref:Uncharacterized protein n=2 Tax=Calcidiscus leptoporus TaxID=127549 RepID=A0A7S0NV75_9EUKA|mmetsp:Transcript_31339/g.72933  ORF Transcript_31339/g.72933 Transcript_31339/m.72933 type:complete len:143 (+) Transcript_31339:132-560(+)